MRFSLRIAQAKENKLRVRNSLAVNAALRGYIRAHEGAEFIGKNTQTVVFISTDILIQFPLLVCYCSMLEAQVTSDCRFLIVWDSNLLRNN